MNAEAPGRTPGPRSLSAEIGVVDACQAWGYRNVLGDEDRGEMPRRAQTEWLTPSTKDARNHRPDN